MKRIQCACLNQTLHFELKEGIGHQEAVAMAQKELENYKACLDRNHIQYYVEEERALPDGSIVLKIKRQYNAYPCGDYLQ